MPERYDPEQVERLIDQLILFERSAPQLRKDIETSDLRSKRAFFAAIVGIVAVIMAITVAFTAISYGNQAQDTSNESLALVKQVQTLTEQINSDRKVNTTGSCIQENARMARMRSALKKSLLALVPQGTTPTEAQQKTITAYNTVVDAELFYRDCSDAGIAEYLKNPPADPAFTK